MVGSLGQGTVGAWSRPVVAALGGTILLLSPLAAPLRGQAEAMPVHADGKVLTATDAFIQTKALLGYTMAAGRTGTLLDTKDDVVACAIDEQIGRVEQVGAAYLFVDEFLDHDPVFPRLQPKPDSLGHYNPMMQMGRLDVAIANIRGVNPSTSTAYTNLILIGCEGRNAEAGGPVIPGSGSVEIFDIHRADYNGQAQFSLFAPPKPGVSPTCTPTFDTQVKAFGLALAVGDVDQDDVDDLIIGAPDTDTGSGSISAADGRYYILRGQPNFLGDSPPPPLVAPPYVPEPYKKWVGINAPKVSGSMPQRFAGSSFGFALDAVDLDGDGAVEILVGRNDRYRNASEPKGGRAYVFRGQYLHGLFAGNPYNPCTNPTGTWNKVFDPKTTDEVVLQVEPPPDYQELTNPFGGYSDGSNDNFGWIVAGIGDIGSLGGGPPDGFPDIAVHSEGMDYIGIGDPENPAVPDAGGLVIYFGVNPADLALSPHWLLHPGISGQYPPYVLLQRPLYLAAGVPGEEKGRVGRAFTGIDWYNPLTGLVEHALMYSEPDADWGGFTDAGLVYLVRPPLCASTPCLSPEFDLWWLLRPLETPNAWTGPLSEPFGDPSMQHNEPISVPSDTHEFGGWMVALDYKGNPLLYKGQQVVISSRGADVKKPSDATGVSTDEAGAAFPFVPPPPGSP